MNAVEQAEAIINALLPDPDPDPMPTTCAGVYGYGQPGLMARCTDAATARCERCGRWFCDVDLWPRGVCLSCDLDYE